MYLTAILTSVTYGHGLSLLPGLITKQNFEKNRQPTMAVSKRLTLGFILASASLTIMAGSIIAPVLNLMRDALGVAPASVGLIITTHGLFMALFSPLMGSVIDRKGARRPYIVALICYGLAGGSGLLINSFWVLLVSRACLGIALAGIFAGINVLILNMYGGIERDRVMGWRGSAQSFGGVIWPLIGGTLGAFSWRFPFAVYMLAIPIGLLAIATVPEPATQRRAGPESRVSASVFGVFRKSPVLLVIYGLMFFGNILLYAIVIFLPQLLESFGISSTFRIGLFITAMTASAGVTAFIYGKIRSRFSYRVIVTIGVALWAVAFTTISQAPGSRLLATGVALFGVSQGLILPTVMVWIGAVVPPSFRGRFSSYLGTFGFIGQFLSPILFAPVFMLVGLNGVFMAGAGVGAAWFLILLFALRRSHKINSYEK
jgi:ACDE family multidrug resistance protein